MKISLTYNAFTEVPSTIFDGLTKLYSVDFMGTPWNCTCDNIWLVNYVNSSGIRLETGLTCTTPTLYASKLLLNVNRRRADNTKDKRKQTKGQTMI
jgi:hypothetical protein